MCLLSRNGSDLDGIGAAYVRTRGAKRGISPGRLHWLLLALASIHLVRGEVISRRFAFYRDLPWIESNKWIRLKRILSGHSNQRLTKNTQKAMQQRI